METVHHRKRSLIENPKQVTRIISKEANGINFGIARYEEGSEWSGQLNHL